jgi:hypothetical protein
MDINVIMESRIRVTVVCMRNLRSSNMFPNWPKILFNLHFMKVSTEIDNNFGYEKITQLVDNIRLIYSRIQIYSYDLLCEPILSVHTVYKQ